MYGFSLRFTVFHRATTDVSSFNFFIERDHLRLVRESRPCPEIASRGTARPSAVRSAFCRLSRVVLGVFLANQSSLHITVLGTCNFIFSNTNDTVGAHVSRATCPFFLLPLSPLLHMRHVIHATMLSHRAYIVFVTTTSICSGSRSI